jgi:hypothetical protein
MSDEQLNVGDVCEIIGTPCPCEKCRERIGRECEILQLEGHHTRFMLSAPLYFEVVFAFVVRVPGENDLVLERQFLRKKHRPSDQTGWIRQLTVPKEAFDRWMKGMRERAPQTAEVDHG